MTERQTEFAHFYEAWRDNCLRAVLAVDADPALAEDLVAEAFARAWAQWGKVQRHPAPQAWVVRTALNTRISWWRRRKRETSIEGWDAPAPASPIGIAPDLVAALRGLTRRQREVVVYRILLDLDVHTTAQLLGISANTVSVHLFRAVEGLRSQLRGPVEAKESLR